MATIEVFQKIGEMTITELRPASMNRAIAQAESARIAEEERLKKEAYDRETQEIAVGVLAKIAEAINAKAEAGGEHLEILWTTDLLDKRNCGIDYTSWVRCESILREILKAHDYSVHDTHKYTSSWVTRSGKIAYVDIYWSK